MEQIILVHWKIVKTHHVEKKTPPKIPKIIWNKCNTSINEKTKMNLKMKWKENIQKEQSGWVIIGLNRFREEEEINKGY